MVLLTAVAVAVAVAGCGRGGNPRAIGVSEVPLPSGATVLDSVRSCDRGANPYCSVQLVVVGPGYGTSTALLAGEQAALKRQGWTSALGPQGKEKGSDSPGHNLRMTYSTAYQGPAGAGLGLHPAGPRPGPRHGGGGVHRLARAVAHPGAGFLVSSRRRSGPTDTAL